MRERREVASASQARKGNPKTAAICAVVLAACGAAISIGVACDPSNSAVAYPSDANGLVLPDVATTDGAASFCASACGADAATCCSTACVNTQNDPGNCGGCGVTCDAVSTEVRGTCTLGTCAPIQSVQNALFTDSPLFLVLSGSILYADEPAGNRFEAVDLSAPGPAKIISIAPTTVPIGDGRGGLYYFSTTSDSHLVVAHYDYVTKEEGVLEDEGPNTFPHVLVRQGNSVARMFRNAPGDLIVVCSNGVTHDLGATSGVSSAAADDHAVYFGLTNAPQSAVSVPCDEDDDAGEAGSPVTKLPTVNGDVLFVNDTSIVWFGTDPAVDAQGKTDGIFISPKDGSGAPASVEKLAENSIPPSFLLLSGDSLYYATSLGLSAAGIKLVLTQTSITKGGATELLTSALPIVLDPAFAYTASPNQGGGYAVVRTPVE